jgi:hypothetical protein
MGAKSRRKGAGGELEVCALLTNHLGSKVSRHLGQARDSGCDVELDPFVIEVKRRKRIGNLHEWMAQAQAACDPERRQYPTVMCRGDGHRWLVVMTLEDWVTLAREELVRS